METTPLIHVGHYKTGTTWLQEHVFGRRDRGFWPISPRNLEGKSAAKFAARFATVCNKGFLLSPHCTAYHCPDWPKLLDGRPERVVPVLSNERISGYFMLSGLDAAAISRRLQTGFPNARILIVIREQRALILSSYLQYLKRGGPTSLSRLLRTRHDHRAPLFSPAYFEFDHIIRTYMDLFGRDRVRVLTYEQFRDSPSDYVRTIYSFAGAEIPNSWGPDASLRENPTGSAAALVASRPMNRWMHRSSLNHFPKRASITGPTLRRIIPTIPTSKALDARVTAYLARQISKSFPHGYFQESNDRVRNVTGLKMAGYD